MLRHTVATLAYRCGKAIADAPEGFAGFRAGPTSRTPVEVLAHIGDLLDWALRVAKGDYTYTEATPRPWKQECERLFAALKSSTTTSPDAPSAIAEQIFQARSRTRSHTGQIRMMRRMAGSPVRGESYFRAEIVAAASARSSPRSGSSLD
jgi:hypothetical protein